MPVAKTNLEVLKRSQKPARRGDIFTYRMKGRPFGFGGVIAVDTKIGGWENVLMVYIYDAFADNESVIPDLSPMQLLLPPLGVDRTPWTLGVFKTLLNRALGPRDALQEHCFFSDTHQRYFDEHGRTLRARVEPCGEWWLGNCYTSDDDISRALGVPYAKRKE